MIVLKQASFGCMRGKRRTQCGLFARITGEAGPEDGEKAAGEAKTAGNKL
jgi:hypothetical protein